MAILSLQSHVAYGHVGNRAAVFPLELLGFDVWPINTVQFSNHTGYESWRGEAFSRGHIELVWSGIRDLGVVADCEAILSGYLGDPSIGQVVLDAVSDVKAARPNALYCCDPVIGDYGTGVFVRDGIESFMANHALSVADIVTPNQFEAELLGDTVIECLDDARRAAGTIHEKGPRIVLITSYTPKDGDEGQVSLFLSEEGRSSVITTPVLAFSAAPSGAGDLAAALFLGHYLHSRDAVQSLERMTNSVFSVLERTQGSSSRELRLVQSADALTTPPKRFAARSGG